MCLKAENIWWLEFASFDRDNLVVLHTPTEQLCYHWNLMTAHQAVPKLSYFVAIFLLFGLIAWRLLYVSGTVCSVEYLLREEHCYISYRTFISYAELLYFI